MIRKHQICRFFIASFALLTFAFLPWAKAEAAKSKGDIKKIVYEYTLDPAELVLGREAGYDTVEFSDSIYMREAGKPRLPFKVLNFALDPDKVITKIELISDKTVELSGEFNIYPAQATTRYSDERVFTPPDSAVYSSSKIFPGVKYKHKKSGFVGETSIAAINVYPVEYIPAQKKIIVHTKMVFRITQKVDKQKTALKGKAKKAKRLKKGQDPILSWAGSLVVNPEDLGAPSDSELEPMAMASPPAGGMVDYLIITNNELRDQNVFQPLMDSKTQKNLGVALETVENIEVNMEGRDTSEKIRNYIIQSYQAGVSYVLLGGDASIIPIRYAVVPPSPEDPNNPDLVSFGNYPYTFEPGQPFPGAEGYIPADLYYSDLDGDWDANGNDIFGEMDGDQLDLYPDIFVGRAPVENAVEAQTFVNKVLTYQNQIATHYDTILMFGAEDFGDSGGWVNDLIENEILTEDFIPAMRYNERETPVYAQEAITEFNQGYHLINHIDHADFDRMYFGGTGEEGTFLTIADYDNLASDFPSSILTSCGCWPAAFDLDAIAEHWVTNPLGGGAAFVGNSRYGLYPESDQMLIPQFYRSLFQDDFRHIGQTLAAAKFAYIAQAAESPKMLYAMLEFNLLGDPEMEIVIDRGGTISSPQENEVVSGVVSIIGSVPEGISYDLMYAPADNIPDQTHILSSIGPVSNGLLGSWDTTLSPGGDGWYVVILSVTINDQLVLSTGVKVYLNNSNSNLPPMFQPVRDQRVDEGRLVEFTVSAFDHEQDNIILSAYVANDDPLSFGDSLDTIGADFSDHQDGTGMFQWRPGIDGFQTEYPIVFVAQDNSGQDTVSTMTVRIIVSRSPRIYNPPPESVIDSLPVLFEWTPAADADQYGICFFECEPGSDLECPQMMCTPPMVETSYELPWIPLDGQPFYVQLWKLRGSAPDWQAEHIGTYRYDRAQARPAEIIHPTTDSVLVCPEVTFEWEPGVGAEGYHLCVSKSSEFFNAPFPNGPQCVGELTDLSTTIQIVPDGNPLYVMLASRLNMQEIEEGQILEYQTEQVHGTAICGVSPSGVLPPETDRATLSLTTNVPATCKYDVVSGRDFSHKAFTFAETGGTQHSQEVTGLYSGMPYRYYVQCDDAEAVINFSVAQSHAINPGRITVNTGQTAQMTFSVMMEPVATKLYMYCPSGLSIGMNGGSNICNRWIDLNLPANSDTQLQFQTINSSTVVRKAVPNFYLYRPSNPDFGIGVFGGITVLPAPQPSPSATPSPSPIALYSSVYVTNPCGADMLEDAYITAHKKEHIPAGAPLQVMNSPQGYATTLQDGYRWWYVWIDDTRYFPYDFGGWMKETDLSTLAPTQPLSCPSPSPSPVPNPT